MTQARERQAQRKARKRQERRETAIALVCVLLFFLLVGRVGWWETHYNRDGKVVSVVGQCVTVEDKTGREWQFYGDGYRVGDDVRMLMFNNGTESIISDDEIIDVKLR